jgi:hypothetical protein
MDPKVNVEGELKPQSKGKRGNRDDTHGEECRPVRRVREGVVQAADFTGGSEGQEAIEQMSPLATWATPFDTS